MTQWIKRARGAVGMGVTWAIGWACAGVAVGVTSLLVPGPFWDTFFAVFDAPLPALAVPGFVGGVLFSVVLGIAGRHRRFEQMSLLRFAGWGALGGLLLSLVPDTLAAVGLMTLRADQVPFHLAALISVPFIGLSALSATVSLLVARRAERQSRDAHPARAPELRAVDNSLIDAGAPGVISGQFTARNPAAAQKPVR